MSKAATAKDGIEPHEPHWTGKWAFQFLVIGTAIGQVAMGFAVAHQNYWVMVPLALVLSHLVHGLIIGLHEASHGMLRKNRTFNEFDGILIGVMGLMSFSLYRAAHQSHHAYLATERDDELWPFVLPHAPRWQRILAASLELTFGMFYTPFLFLRAFLKKNTNIRARKVRTRIWKELFLMVIVWATIILSSTSLGIWPYTIWMLIIPSFIAGNLQSLRKYIEHVGLHGDTPTAATRSIVDESWLGKLMAFSLLHEPFHGVHHRHSGLPHPVLPQYAPILRRDVEVLPPFRSYTHALIHLMGCLRDPKVGVQWLEPRQNAASKHGAQSEPMALEETAA